MPAQRRGFHQTGAGVVVVFGRWRARRHLNVVGVWLVFSCVGNIPSPSESLLSSPAWAWSHHLFPAPRRAGPLPTQSAALRFAQTQKQVVGWPRIGVASWYSQQDPGVTPLTANGEPFTDSTFTAAMWDLPFDSCVQVTNLRTLQRVVVRINDRGPHHRLVRQGRLIDLSRAAFAQVADLHEGLIPVQMEIVDVAVCQVAPPLEPIEPIDTPTLSS